MPYLGSTPPAIPISGTDIEAGTISTANIADDAVTLAKIADVNVTTAKIADVNVTTAKIANDAVTLAKLAAGTDGELITWDAAGNPAAVPVGTSTHVLTSNGTGAAPTFQAAAAGGAWTLIGTQVASNSASLTQTGLTDVDYDTYGIVLSGMVPASNNVDPMVRLGDSSGIDSGSTDYSWGAHGGDWSTNARRGSNGDTAMRLAGNAAGIGNGKPLGATIFLTVRGSATYITSMHGQCQFTTTDASYENGYFFYGTRQTAIVTDRFQFFFASGNITTGRMSVYGISYT